MTNKELRHLSRSELLQLLLSQSEENRRLKKQLEEAHKKLKERQLVMDQAGSIAQAALQLNGVFEAAEEAAKQYLESVMGGEAPLTLKPAESSVLVAVPVVPTHGVKPQKPVETPQPTAPCVKTENMSNEEYWQKVRLRAQSLLGESR